MKSTIAIRHPELDIEDLLELEGENFEERYNKLFNEAFGLTTTKHELIDVLGESGEKLLTSKDAYNTLYLGLIRSRVREKLQPYLYGDMSRDLLDMILLYCDDNGLPSIYFNDYVSQFNDLGQQGKISSIVDHMTQAKQKLSTRENGGHKGKSEEQFLKYETIYNKNPILLHLANTVSVSLNTLLDSSEPSLEEKKLLISYRNILLVLAKGFPLEAGKTLISLNNSLTQLPTS